MAGVGCSSEELKGRIHARSACKLQRRISGHNGKATGGHAVLVNKWNGNLREEIVGTTYQRLCGESAVGNRCKRRKTETESCINCQHPGKCQTVHNDTHRGGASWPHSSKRKCPHDLLCREKLLEAVPGGSHNAQIESLVDAISSLRWAQDELNDNARTSHLGRAMATAYFFVLGVQVCLSTFCWAHGHTRHRLHQVKKNIASGQSGGVDKRASLSGRKGTHSHPHSHPHRHSHPHVAVHFHPTIELRDTHTHTLSPTLTLTLTLTPTLTLTLTPHTHTHTHSIG